MTWNWQMTLMQKGEKYFIGMRIIQGGDIRYIIKQGEKIMILLENGKIVELEMDKDYLPVANVGAGGITTLWLTNSEVDRKTMKRLSRSPITDIKVVIQGVDIVMDSKKLKDKQVNAIMDAATCIIGE
jgi:hypothetical protein